MFRIVGELGHEVLVSSSSSTTIRVATTLLEYVQAGQNGNPLSRGDVQAVRGNQEEAVGAPKGGNVAGTLPAKGRDTRGKFAPFEACREKVAEAGLFLDSFEQGGFEQRKRARRCAAKKVKRGNSEQLKGDHGGDGIPRQAEHPDVLATAEDRGPAGANGNRVKEEVRPQALKNGFDEVVLPHRNTAREDEDISAEAQFNFCAQVVDSI